eukprot:COSAG06_NODE_328_length_17440_cov_46.327836_13_plen_378_part_00
MSGQHVAAQCTAGEVTVPDNGALGTTTCSGAGDDLADGTTCDLTCNTGYTLSDQPSCADAAWVTTTATCTADACDISGVTAPTNGALGTNCAGSAGTIDSGASCDLTCDTNYALSDQPSCTAGTVSPSTATCAAIVCARPADIAGYDVTDNELNVVTGFDVAVACAAGYEGTAAVTACDAQGGAYTLGGCTAVVCTTPTGDAIAPYTVSDEQLTRGASTFAATVACAANYESTGDGPAATACDASGAYTLSGCVAIVCVQPTSIAGYTVTNTELSTVGGGFDVTVECDAATHSVHGHDDVSAAAAACTANGDAYTLSGCACTECVCTAPDTTGYVIIGTNLGGAGTEFDVHSTECACSPATHFWTWNLPPPPPPPLH